MKLCDCNVHKLNFKYLFERMSSVRDIYLKISASNSGSKYKNIPKFLNFRSKPMIIKLRNADIDVDTPFSKINQYLYDALNAKLESAASGEEEDSLYSNAYREIISFEKATDIFSIDSISFERSSIKDMEVQSPSETVFIVINRGKQNDNAPKLPDTPEYTPQSIVKDTKKRHDEAQSQWIARTSKPLTASALFKLKFK